jgi:nicotinamidase-related amidase
MLIDRARSCLLIIDLQARLAPEIEGAGAVIANAERLAIAARRLDVPRLATEQYRRGLGGTVEKLAALVPPGNVIEKTWFAAPSEPQFRQLLSKMGRDLMVIAGMESHVCVLQTAIALKATGYAVAVVADAVGSRHAADRIAALERLAAHGVELPTTEMVIFEWLQRGRSAEFRDLLPLLK